MIGLVMCIVLCPCDKVNDILALHASMHVFLKKINVHNHMNYVNAAAGAFVVLYLLI